MSIDDATKTAIFDTLTDLVRAAVAETGLVVIQDDGRLDVDVPGPVEVNGRKYDKFNLLSVQVMKHHVGFYFMPVYVAPATIQPTLSDVAARMLKGKSCFHCKQPFTDDLRAEFEGLVVRGVQLYRNRGWLRDGTA